MSRRPLAVLALLPLAAAVAAGGAVASQAAWTDTEWDRGALAALDCAAPGIGTSTASGRLLGGELLGVDLDGIAELAGMRVDSDGSSSTPDPSSADPVPDSDGEAFENPLEISALGAISLALGELLVLPLDTEAGVVNQYARASDDATSAGAAGAVADDGGIELETEDDPLVPGDERPDLARLELGTVLEAALGESLSEAVTGLADLGLDIGAVASAASLDGCAAAWDGQLDDELVRQYAIAGLDLDVESPLVGGLVAAVDGVLGGLEDSVEALAGDEALLDGILDAVLALPGVVGALTGVSLLPGADVGLSVGLDLDAVRSLLDDTISDDDGIVAIDLAAGRIGVDIEALFGSVYGTDGLNGLPPNSELLVDDELLAALEDAVTDAVAAWAADLVAALGEALDAVAVEAVVTVPVGAHIVVPPLVDASIVLGALRLEVDASLAALLDGSATATRGFDPESCTLGPVLCELAEGTIGGLVLGLLGGLTEPVLDAVALTVGQLVDTALDELGTGLEDSLDAALDAPVAALLGLLDGSLGFLFSEEGGVLSILVNAQDGSAGLYSVEALRITVVGALDAVVLQLARSTVGPNAVIG